MSTLTGALLGALLASGGTAGSVPKASQLEPLASRATRESAREQLADLANPVRLVVFTREYGDRRLGEAAVALAEGLAELSPQVTAEVHDLDVEPEAAEAHGVTLAPAIVVVGAEDRGVRFYGVPGGREFESLLSAIRVASAGDSGLSGGSRQALAGLAQAVEIEVFVTLDCPQCSRAVELAHRLAMESSKVAATMVETSAFPDLANARGVSVVPMVALNGVKCFEGARAEDAFVEAVVEAGSGD